MPDPKPPSVYFSLFNDPEEWPVLDQGGSSDVENMKQFIEDAIQSSLRYERCMIAGLLMKWSRDWGHDAIITARDLSIKIRNLNDDA